MTPFCNALHESGDKQISEGMQPQVYDARDPMAMIFISQRISKNLHQLGFVMFTKPLRVSHEQGAIYTH
jgi:hypothetical protein